jgi:phosphohistidine phosphatase
VADQVELYLVRHGVAVERGEAYPEDGKRPLTQRGIERVKQAAEGLIALDVDLDVIVTSPLVRARQTAEILAAAFSSHPPVISSGGLAPGAGRNAILDELAERAQHGRIALVGHEPDMGELAARLIGARTPLEFKKGAVCRIDVQALPPAGPGRLRWFATPRMLRKAAG